MHSEANEKTVVFEISLPDDEGCHECSYLELFQQHLVLSRNMFIISLLFCLTVSTIFIFVGFILLLVFSRPTKISCYYGVLIAQPILIGQGSTLSVGVVLLC